MPSRTLKDAANSSLAIERRKNGRWMNQWAIVFEPHHTPSATTTPMRTPSVLVIDERANRRVSGATLNFRDADVDGIIVGRGRRFVAAANAGAKVPPAAEGHDLSRTGNRLQIRPLIACDLFVGGREPEVKISLRRRQIIVGIVRFRHRKDAPDLNPVRSVLARLQHDSIDARVDGIS